MEAKKKKEEFKMAVADLWPLGYIVLGSDPRRAVYFSPTFFFCLFMLGFARGLARRIAILRKGKSFSLKNNIFPTEYYNM